jgi:hypothetical protein
MDLARFAAPVLVLNICFPQIDSTGNIDINACAAMNFNEH